MSAFSNFAGLEPCTAIKYKNNTCQTQSYVAKHEVLYTQTQRMSLPFPSKPALCNPFEGNVQTFCSLDMIDTFLIYELYWQLYLIVS